LESSSLATDPTCLPADLAASPTLRAEAPACFARFSAAAFASLLFEAFDVFDVFDSMNQSPFCNKTAITRLVYSVAKMHYA
jgi:hypothetical protein